MNPFLPTLLSAAVVCCAAPPSDAASTTSGASPRIVVPVAGGAAASVRPAGFLIEPAPAWVVPAVERPDAAVEPASWHYRLVDQQVRLDGRLQESYSHVVRVVNDASGLAAASQVAVEFDPAFQSLVLHHVDVVRDGRRLARLDRGKVQLLQRETQLERLVYDGRITALMVLDDVRAGDRIDYAYTVRGANPVFGGRYVQNVFALSGPTPGMLFQHRLLAPAERRIAWAGRPSDARTSSRVVDGAWRETVVRRESMPAWQPEPRTPSWAVRDEMLFASEFTDWGEVAAWGRDLFVETGPAPAIDAKAAQLRTAHADPAARLLAALDFVQKEVRYFGNEIGLNTHRPAAPEKVLQQRFGDCKDKVALLLALLRRMDIAGEPVLVSMNLRSRVAQALPSPLAFDHVIARVTLDGRSYWLDPTLTHQSGPLAARQALGFGQGLVLGAGSAGLTALPKPQDDELLRVEDRFVVEDFTLPPTLEARVTYRGEMAEHMRRQLADLGVEAVQKMLAESYVQLYPKARTLQPMGVEPVAGDDAVTLVQRFSVPGFWQWKGADRPPTAEVGAWSVFSALRLPATEARRYPYESTLPGTYSHRIAIRYPEPTLEERPAVEFNGGDAHFSVHVKGQQDPRGVEVTARAVLKTDAVLPQDWAAYSERVRQAVPQLGSAVTFPALPPARIGQFKADVQTLAGKVGSGRLRLVTPTQQQAHLTLLLLDHLIDGGRLPAPLLAQALTERGVQNDHLGRLEAARRDFELALGLAPDDPKVLAGAAVNSTMRGDSRRALELTEAVLRQSPDDRKSLETRVLAHYVAGDYAAARDRLAALLEDAGAWRRGYSLVMWSLVQRRTGGDAPRPLLQRAHEGDLPTDWPRPLIDWAQGRTDGDGLLRSAGAGTGATAAERLCEAYFYLGEKAEAEGDRGRALEYFRKSVEQGVTEFTEHGLARLRLAALEQQQRR